MMISIYTNTVNSISLEGINDPPTGIQLYTLTVYSDSCKDCEEYKDTVEGESCLGWTNINFTLDHKCDEPNGFDLDVGRYYCELSLSSVVHATFDLFIYDSD